MNTRKPLYRILADGRALVVLPATMPCPECHRAALLVVVGSEGITRCIPCSPAAPHAVPKE